MQIETSHQAVIAAQETLILITKKGAGVQDL